MQVVRRLGKLLAGDVDVLDLVARHAAVFGERERPECSRERGDGVGLVRNTRDGAAGAARRCGAQRSVHRLHLRGDALGRIGERPGPRHFAVGVIIVLPGGVLRRCGRGRREREARDEHQQERATAGMMRGLHIRTP